MFYLFNFLESTSWQIDFQDPATPIAGRIIEMHHHVFFFLLITLIFVSWMMFSILSTFLWNLPDNGSTLSKANLGTLKQLSLLKLTHNTTVEVIWTIMPSIILILIAMPSFGLLYAMDDIIDPEVTVKAMGYQWYWSYEYSDYVSTAGQMSFDSYMLPEDELSLGQLSLLEVDNSMVLPVGTYVSINVTAADVIHSWTVPSLGVKIDAVPHSINSGVIFLQSAGVFYGQCSEICGVNHGFMPIVVKGVSINNYINWINSFNE